MDSDGMFKQVPVIAQTTTDLATYRRSAFFGKERVETNDRYPHATFDVLHRTDPVLWVLSVSLCQECFRCSATDSGEGKYIGRWSHGEILGWNKTTMHGSTVGI